MSELAALTAERFESLIGHHITMLAAHGEESWRVVEVKRREAHALRSDQPFNLYLVAPANDGNRSQGVYRGRLENGDAFELFAVPIAAKNNEITFEVIFN
jgi:hypothetical protein